jgi:hypothetical protein
LEQLDEDEEEGQIFFETCSDFLKHFFQLTCQPEQRQLIVLGLLDYRLQWTMQPKKLLGTEACPLCGKGGLEEGVTSEGSSFSKSSSESYSSKASAK